MQKNNRDNSQPRRNALLKVSAIATSPVWSKPIVNQIVLPAHAITTDDTGGGGPGVTTTSAPGVTTTSAPGVTTTPPPVTGQGEVFICAANGRDCVSQGNISCGGNLGIGTLSSNSGVRIIIAGFPPNETVSVSAPGNENCISCSDDGTATTDGSGNLNLRFSTGGGSVLHTITITLRECTLQINWTA